MISSNSSLVYFSGIPIYSVETVQFLVRDHLSEGADLVKSNYLCNRGVGHHYVTAIRYKQFSVNGVKISVVLSKKI